REDSRAITSFAWRGAHNKRRSLLRIDPPWPARTRDIRTCPHVHALEPETGDGPPIARIRWINLYCPCPDSANEWRFAQPLPASVGGRAARPVAGAPALRLARRQLAVWNDDAAAQCRVSARVVAQRARASAGCQCRQPDCRRHRQDAV